MKGLKSNLIEEIKKEILGEHYELSFAFVSQKRIQELNKKLRKKDEPTDVLSFSLSKNSGEILICKEIAKLKSTDFKMKLQKYLILLVIHGMLHLKGMLHSSTMTKAETKFLKMFS